MKLGVITKQSEIDIVFNRIIEEKEQISDFLESYQKIAYTKESNRQSRCTRSCNAFRI